MENLQSWVIGAMTAIVGFLGGLVAYRKNYADVQEQNIKALELRIKTLEKAEEDHIRDKAGLALTAQMHEDDWRKLWREGRQMERAMEKMERRVHQLEAFVQRSGLALPEANGEDEETHDEDHMRQHGG